MEGLTDHSDDSRRRQSGRWTDVPDEGLKLQTPPSSNTTMETQWGGHQLQHHTCPPTPPQNQHDSRTTLLTTFQCAGLPTPRTIEWNCLPPDVVSAPSAVEMMFKSPVSNPRPTLSVPLLWTRRELDQQQQPRPTYAAPPPTHPAACCCWSSRQPTHSTASQPKNALSGSSKRWGWTVSKEEEEEEELHDSVGFIVITKTL